MKKIHRSDEISPSATFRITIMFHLIRILFNDSRTHQLREDIVRLRFHFSADKIVVAAQSARRFYIYITSRNVFFAKEMSVR